MTRTSWIADLALTSHPFIFSALPVNQTDLIKATATATSTTSVRMKDASMMMPHSEVAFNRLLISDRALRRVEVNDG
jgi:hypothetical protein